MPRRIAAIQRRLHDARCPPPAVVSRRNDRVLAAARLQWATARWACARERLELDGCVFVRDVVAPVWGIRRRCEASRRFRAVVTGARIDWSVRRGFERRRHLATAALARRVPGFHDAGRNPAQRHRSAALFARHVVARKS